MSSPILITETAERKWLYPERSVRLPVWERPPGRSSEWSEKHRWRLNYHVHLSNYEEADKLKKRLWELGENPDPQEEAGIIERLRQIESPQYEDKTHVQRWGFSAVQMPTDWGPVGPKNKNKLKQLMTNLAHGTVLEAMCGFTSYFDNSPKISEVVALDFCREGLERYDYPERKRILFDLERICRGEKMDFFEDNSFETIGVFFGMRYLLEMFPVFQEFQRVLSPGGKLLVVENPHQGYPDLLKHGFNPEQFASEVEDAGFRVRLKELKSITLKKGEVGFTELGDYWLVEGTKKV